MKMHSIESRFVIGPSDILFDGVYGCTFQPRNFTGWDSEGVNPSFSVSAQQLFLFDLHVLNAGQRARQRPTRFGWLTLSLPPCHLKTNDNNAKSEIHTPFFVLALASEKISVKTILKVDLFDIYRIGKCTVCRHLCGLFNPGVIRTGAVKGLHLF